MSSLHRLDPKAKFLTVLVLSVVAWATALLAFVILIDPYGLSPLSLPVARINALKPARVDIDRQIKPYEVWRQQPRTVFLGTSRVHQSMNPGVLDGSRYAPAYNASIPAGSLASNIANLEQYVQIDPNLKSVFIELFIYNFLGTAQNYTLRSKRDVFSEIVPFFVSTGALWDAYITLLHNVLGRAPSRHIAPGGYFVQSPGINPVGLFAGFPAGIWALHPNGRSAIALHDDAFETFRTMNRFAREHGIELVWVATPNHAYSDYFFDAVGAWDLVEEWLRRLTAEATVYSYSQPNDWVYEPVSKDMRYWNDPFHASLAMGDGMLSLLADRSSAGAPDDLLQRLTPQDVPGHIERRKAAIQRWANDQRNAAFIEQFAEEQRQKNEDAPPLGKIAEDGLRVDGRAYSLARRVAGALENAVQTQDGYLVSGWAADAVANGPVTSVVVAVGDTIVTRTRPTIDRLDIAQGIASGAQRSGFSVDVHVARPAGTPKSQIRIFGLMADGVAVQLASSLAGTTGGAFADAPFGAGP